MKASRGVSVRATAVGAALTLSTAGAWAADEPKPVAAKIVNTAAEAVPVAPQGTTTVAGEVAVTNTPTVRLEAGGRVGLDPAANTVRIADRVPGQRFHYGERFSGYQNVRLFEVPSAKTLVIEMVSAHFAAPPGVVPLLIMTNSSLATGHQWDMFLAAISQGVAWHPDPTRSEAIFAATAPVRMYAGPGTGVYLQVIPRGYDAHDPGNSPQTELYITVTGYLVDTTE